MFGLSFWELAVILVLALLVLGPERLPKMLRSVGRGMRELRQASAGLRDAIEEPLEEIRRPLQDIRNELVDTVHRAEQAVQQESARVQSTVDEASGRIVAAATTGRRDLEQPQDAPDAVDEPAYDLPPDGTAAAEPASSAATSAASAPPPPTRRES